MRKGVLTFVCCCCCSLAAPAIGRAQPVTPPPDPDPEAAAVQLPAPTADTFWAPFRAVPGDFARFFSFDTARILGVASAGVMVAHRWDDDGIALALGRLRPVTAFRPGNIGGGLYAQVGGAFGVYALGRAFDSRRTSEVGADLFRTQVLTQAIVQGMKLTFRRMRPDGSSRMSLPSGHAAGAVATATVLQQHFGWKVGVPAYVASAYVGASRMSENKHHLTDIMVGAAVGVASARTVTVTAGKHRFSVGVAPTDGGAAVTFTKQ